MQGLTNIYKVIENTKKSIFKVEVQSKKRLFRSSRDEFPTMLHIHLVLLM